MTDTSQIEEPIRPALLRGWRCKCPRCGEGRLFDGLVKVRAQCDACGLDYSPQRADDGPAYLTILVVGHVMALVLHAVFVWFEPSPLVLATSLSVVAIGMSLWLLPRFKGGLIAFQWAKGMHGFDPR